MADICVGLLSARGARVLAGLMPVSGHARRGLLTQLSVTPGPRLFPGTVRAALDDEYGRVRISPCVPF